MTEDRLEHEYIGSLGEPRDTHLREMLDSGTLVAGKPA